MEQHILLPANPRDLCKEIGLNWWAALKLRDDGWLSFDPESHGKLTESQEAELRFLGSLVTAGCDPDLMQRMLKNLSKPYSFPHGSIYYDWAMQKWSQLPEEPDPEEVCHDWIEELREQENVETLKRVAGDISSALSQLENERHTT